METPVYAAVLVAALLHAGWNSVVKVGLDRRASIVLLAVVQALVAAPLLPFVQAPASAAWPWIFGAALLHAFYKIFLVEAYARADLSQVYPLARGTAPLLVALATFWALGERIEPGAMAALALISGGIMVMALKGSPAQAMTGTALFFAIGTAVFTASYTIIDGIGARIAGTASGFILWLLIFDALVMLIYWCIYADDRKLSTLLPAWKTGLIGGVMSLGSYWIAVWAFTKAPIAMVAALREASIVFAVVIAFFILKEHVSAWRWGSAGAIALGVFLLKA